MPVVPPTAARAAAAACLRTADDGGSSNLEASEDGPVTAAAFASGLDKMQAWQLHRRIPAQRRRRRRTAAVPVLLQRVHRSSPAALAVRTTHTRSSAARLLQAQLQSQLQAQLQDLHDAILSSSHAMRSPRP